MVRMSNTQAAVLWTGGKDSAWPCARPGWRASASRAWRRSRRRRPLPAHPLEAMAAQAAALRLPHRVLEVVEPFEQGYRDAIERLCRDEGLSAIVTGDIAEVAGLPNWIRQCCQGWTWKW